MNNRPIASQQRYNKQASTPAGKNELLQYATSPVNEQPLIDKYRKDFISSEEEVSIFKAKQNPTIQEITAIKNIAIEYPRHEVSNGVEMLDGLSNDRHEMPMQKEYLTARLVAELLKEKLILLPRFMDRILNRIVGRFRFDNYSLADGISAVNSDGKTYEFKFTSRKDKIVNNLNNATKKADVSVVIVSSEERLKPKDFGNFKGKGEAVVINIYNPENVEAFYKKEASTEWKPIRSDTQSQLKLGDPSSIKNLASELKSVKSDNQTSMDYDVYNKNNNTPLRFNKLIDKTSDKDLLEELENGETIKVNKEEGSRYRKNVDTAYTYSQGIKLTKPTKPTNFTKPTNLIKPTKPTMPTNLTKATNPTKRLLMGY